LLLAAVLSAACGESTPTEPTVVNWTGAVKVEDFQGTLDLNGSAFYSFRVPARGTVSFVLQSLREGGVDSSALVLVGFGVPRGTGCTVTTPAGVTAKPTPQGATVLDPGIYCVQISDSGNLTAPATFAMVIISPL